MRMFMRCYASINAERASVVSSRPHININSVLRPALLVRCACSGNGKTCTEASLNGSVIRIICLEYNVNINLAPTNGSSYSIPALYYHLLLVLGEIVLVIVSTNESQHICDLCTIA